MRTSFGPNRTFRGYNGTMPVLALLLSLTICSVGQAAYFSIKGLTNFSDFNQTGTNTSGSTRIAAFGGGVGMGTRLADVVTFETELLLNQRKFRPRGWDSPSGALAVAPSQHYIGDWIQVPALIHVHWWGIFYAGGGAYVGYALNELTRDNGDGTTDQSFGYSTVGSKRLDLGFVLSLGTEFKLEDMKSCLWFIETRLTLSGYDMADSANTTAKYVDISLLIGLRLWDDGKTSSPARSNTSRFTN